MNILAIESSCDETAAAVVRDGREVLSNIVNTQIAEHIKYGGVVPEIASRRHVTNISYVAEAALSEASLTMADVDAVAVTYAPGLIGALLVGVNFAKGLAYAHKKPLVPVHHIRSHVAANYIAHRELKPPFIALIASGSHSHIVLVSDYTRYKILGRTRDDAAGEAFDKAARVLGLPYPGGVHIDRLSREGDAKAIKFPRVHFKDAPYDFSFSGVKTAVINYAHTLSQRGESIDRADAAASFSEAVTGILSENVIKAALDFKVGTVVMAGGVCANSMLREKLEAAAGRHGLSLYMPPVALCTDNAAMVGSQAFYEYENGRRADLTLNGRSAESIE
ncbi:MAG: tRNA (adenosine(37)-N6)-threonylcarbamoyltransferase complex transferase subunit TsaD [Clostridia bacterium]|nr:tRNA (adenosine(37)-N6)-threonylcarbamoyltransferase complex transferase subunit TsaD [Clostridia bacterium]